LYATALELGQHSDTARSSLFERLGDALANAGRGERAASAYGEASRGAQAARALDLQRRGADQLMRSGHVDEGLASMRRVLASIGLALPRSPLSALFLFLAYRVYLRVRGLGFRPRDASEVSATDLTRIDVCWSLAFGLGVADTLRGAAFQARNLLLALRSGERYRIARAFAAEAVYASREGGRANRRTDSLMDRAHALAAESREPHAIGWAEGAAGAAYFMTGRFDRALEHLERARVIVAEVPGAVWELDTIAHFSTMCLVQLGQIGRVVRETPKAVREARQRGDLYAAVNLRVGLPNLAWLAVGGAEAALAQADEAMSEWSKGGFHLEHYYELLARAHALLYDGRAREAYAYVLARWPALRRSLLSLTIQSTRIQTLHARARSAIAAAEEGGADRATLLRDAATMSRRIEREGVEWAAPWAKLLRAGIATGGATRGEGDERAAALLREAIVGFDAASMALYAAAARRCLGGLLRGDEGRELVHGADAWMRTEMIKDPARMTAMLAPGFSRAAPAALAGDREKESARVS
jgi:tetratricopeptide (TPR) repeat protein